MATSVECKLNRGQHARICKCEHHVAYHPHTPWNPYSQFCDMLTGMLDNEIFDVATLDGTLQALDAGQCQQSLANLLVIHELDDVDAVRTVIEVIAGKVVSLCLFCTTQAKARSSHAALYLNKIAEDLRLGPLTKLLEKLAAMVNSGEQYIHCDANSPCQRIAVKQVIKDVLRLILLMRKFEHSKLQRRLQLFHSQLIDVVVITLKKRIYDDDPDGQFVVYSIVGMLVSVCSVPTWLLSDSNTECIGRGHNSELVLKLENLLETCVDALQTTERNVDERGLTILLDMVFLLECVCSRPSEWTMSLLQKTKSLLGKHAGTVRAAAVNAFLASMQLCLRHEAHPAKHANDSQILYSNVALDGLAVLISLREDSELVIAAWNCLLQLSISTCCHSLLGGVLQTASNLIDSIVQTIHNPETQDRCNVCFRCLDCANKHITTCAFPWICEAETAILFRSSRRTVDCYCFWKNHAQLPSSSLQTLLCVFLQRVVVFTSRVVRAVERMGTECTLLVTDIACLLRSGECDDSLTMCCLELLITCTQRSISFCEQLLRVSDVELVDGISPFIDSVLNWLNPTLTEDGRVLLLVIQLLYSMFEWDSLRSECAEKLRGSVSHLGSIIQSNMKYDSQEHSVGFQTNCWLLEMLSFDERSRLRWMDISGILSTTEASNNLAASGKRLMREADCELMIQAAEICFRYDETNNSLSYRDTETQAILRVLASQSDNTTILQQLFRCGALDFVAKVMEIEMHCSVDYLNFGSAGALTGCLDAIRAFCSCSDLIIYEYLVEEVHIVERLTRILQTRNSRTKLIIVRVLMTLVAILRSTTTSRLAVAILLDSWSFCDELKSILHSFDSGSVVALICLLVETTCSASEYYDYLVDSNHGMKRIAAHRELLEEFLGAMAVYANRKSVVVRLLKCLRGMVGVVGPVIHQSGLQLSVSGQWVRLLLQLLQRHGGDWAYVSVSLACIGQLCKFHEPNCSRFVNGGTFDALQTVFSSSRHDFQVKDQTEMIRALLILLDQPQHKSAFTLGAFVADWALFPRVVVNLFRSCGQAVKLRKKTKEDHNVSVTIISQGILDALKLLGLCLGNDKLGHSLCSDENQLCAILVTLTTLIETSMRFGPLRQGIFAEFHESVVSLEVILALFHVVVGINDKVSKTCKLWQLSSVQIVRAMSELYKCFLTYIRVCSSSSELKIYQQGVSSSEIFSFERGVLIELAHHQWGLILTACRDVFNSFATIQINERDAKNTMLLGADDCFTDGDLFRLLPLLASGHAGVYTDSVNTFSAACGIIATAYMLKSGAAECNMRVANSSRYLVSNRPDGVHPDLLGELLTCIAELVVDLTEDKCAQILSAGLHTINGMCRVEAGRSWVSLMVGECTYNSAISSDSAEEAVRVIESAPTTQTCQSLFQLLSRLHDYPEVAKEAAILLVDISSYSLEFGQAPTEPNFVLRRSLLRVDTLSLAHSFLTSQLKRSASCPGNPNLFASMGVLVTNLCQTTRNINNNLDWQRSSGIRSEKPSGSVTLVGTEAAVLIPCLIAVSRAWLGSASLSLLKRNYKQAVATNLLAVYHLAVSSSVALELCSRSKDLVDVIRSIVLSCGHILRQPKVPNDPNMECCGCVLQLIEPALRLLCYISRSTVQLKAIMSLDGKQSQSIPQLVMGFLGTVHQQSAMGVSHLDWQNTECLSLGLAFLGHAVTYIDSNCVQNSASRANIWPVMAWVSGGTWTVTSDDHKTSEQHLSSRINLLTAVVYAMAAILRIEGTGLYLFESHANDLRELRVDSKTGSTDTDSAYSGHISDTPKKFMSRSNREVLESSVAVTGNPGWNISNRIRSHRTAKASMSMPKLAVSTSRSQQILQTAVQAFTQTVSSSNCVSDGSNAVGIRGLCDRLVLQQMGPPFIPYDSECNAGLKYGNESEGLAFLVELCVTISGLCISSPQCQHLFGTFSACELLLDCLENLLNPVSNDQSLRCIVHVLHCLAVLCKDCMDNRSRISNLKQRPHGLSGGLHIIIRVMTAHNDSLDVQVAGSLAVGLICQGNAANTSTAYAAGAPVIVANAGELCREHGSKLKRKCGESQPKKSLLIQVDSALKLIEWTIAILANSKKMMSSIHM
jgi:hypothetical protein